MKQLSVLYLQSSNAGVAWYRLYSWAVAAHRTRTFYSFLPFWDKALTDVHPWQMDLNDPVYRHRILGELDSHVKKADVVVAQMVHTPPAIELLKGIKEMYPHIPLVSESDDNILSTPTYNPADTVYRPGSMFRAIAVEQFKMSDAMIVSTPYLKEVYGDMCGNVQVMQNSLDFRLWDNLKHKRNKELVRIGWAGGSSHSEDLRIVEPIVRKILEQHKNVRFCFVHGIPDFLRGIDRVEEVHQFTRIDKYPQFLASRAFDIGIAPLVDNAFNRGKSNLRWLEYAGLSVPCVASNVGHFAETIRNGTDGFLCSTEQEWISTLNDLIANRNLRKAVGKAANKRARRDFNVESNISRYEEILRAIVDKGQVVKLPSLAPVEVA
jgi:glycosyltransferase involved in cell wall biosynthesis